MIVTEQKPLEEILRSLEGHKRLFLVGCGSCATAWHTGGEPEVKEIAEKLKQAGKEITGFTISEEACDERKIRRELRAHPAEVEAADAILVMSCGAGVQTIALLLENTPVYPGLNALFLARLQRLTKADERCVLCGDCILAQTGGICPIATCPKELLNGPCGGYKDGMCEVDPTRECTWVTIYNRLKRLGQLDRFQTLQTPKNQAKRVHARRVDKEKVAAAT